MSRPPVEVRINEIVFFSPSGWTSERGNRIEIKMDPPALVDLVNFHVKSVSLGGAYDLFFFLAHVGSIRSSPFGLDGFGYRILLVCVHVNNRYKNGTGVRTVRFSPDVPRV